MLHYIILLCLFLFLMAYILHTPALFFPRNDNLLTAWNRGLIETLTVPQEVKEFPHFMEPESSSLHS